MYHLLEFVNKVAKDALNEEEMVAKIRSVLYKNYVKTVVENRTDVGFRMIFIGNRFKSDFRNPLTSECNGAVMFFNRAENKWTPLLIPTQLFNANRMSSKEIETKYRSGDYNVYPVVDGTLANLYFFEGKWRISTNKAYDATSLQFIHGKTYSDIFFECGGSFDNLDNGYCYTVCITSSAFHVANKLSKVTYIQRVNLSDRAKEMMQEPIEPIAWRELKNKLHSAVLDFKNKREMFLGVILRSEKESILLESNLMIKIRNFLYNFEFSKKLEPGTDLILANKLQVFLNRRDVSLFLALFPFYKKDFNKYNQILDGITEDICAGKLTTAYHRQVVQDLNDKKIDISASSWKLVSDFIRNPNYIAKLYDLVA